MKKIFKFHFSNKQVFELALEDSMRIYSLIGQLKAQNLLDANQSYSVKTITGLPVLDENMIKDFKVDEFIINESEMDSIEPSLPEETSIFVVPTVKSPKIFHQLGILVLDGSGSMEDNAKMNISKAESVNIAVRGLLGRLKAGDSSDNFSFAIIMFGNDVKEHTPITHLSHIDDNDDFDPLIVDGSNTKIYLGLSEAVNYAETFMRNAPIGSVPHSVLILLMSDGVSENPAECIEIANQVKNNPQLKATIACAYFGTIGANDPEAQELLQQISSGSNYYKTTYNDEDLRRFFEASISQSAGIRI
jgi:uncharacterized protein YegL